MNEPEKLTIGDIWTRDRDGSKWVIIFTDEFVKVERQDDFEIKSYSFKDFFEQFSR